MSDPNSETLRLFAPLQQKSNCPYARSAKLSGCPMFDMKRSFDFNILACLPSFRALASCSRRKLDPNAVDGLVLAIPLESFEKTIRGGGYNAGYGTESDPFDNLGRVVGQVFCLLCGEDKSSLESVRKLLENQMDSGWRFSFDGVGMFVSVFAPCYPESSSRYQHGVAEEYFFMLFQPDILFQRRGITPAAEQRIRNSFTSAGQPYGTEGNAVVKPENEFRDPPLKWWKIGGRGEIARPPPAVPLKALPTKPDGWRFPDDLRRFIPSIGEEVSKAWESSLEELGPLLSWEYNEGIELGCPAMLLFLEALKAEKYRQGIPFLYSFGWHGTSEAHAREIMRDGFDPSKRSIQTYGPGEYLARHALDAAPYSKGEGVLLFCMVNNHDCEAIYGTNLHSAARVSFAGPVHQYRVNNPPDRSSTYCLPLGIAHFHDKSPQKPTPSSTSTTQGGPSSSKTQKKGISIPQLQARYVQREKKIGAGGAAEVWLANLRDPSRPSRSVVVKVPLQSSLAQSSFGTANAQREAQMAFQLQHPFLVKFYGTVSGEEFGDFGLVFEYCEKGDLFEYMHPPMGSEPRFSLNHRIQIAFDIIRALVYLHGQTPPIIHRDVKSPNILLTNESGKLADLGLATFFTTLVSTGASKIRSGSSNRTTNAGGTPSWQAPETFGLGGKKRATPKADVFSFGVLLWELLTLEIPWEGETEFDIKEGVKEGERLEVPEEPVFPQSYIDLMTHCWKPKPADRPTSLEVLQKLVEIRNEMFDAHSFRIWDHSNFQHSCSIREDRWANHASVENLHYLKLSNRCLPNEEQAVLNLLSAEVNRVWEVLELNAVYSPLCFGRWTQWMDTFPSLQSGNIYTKKFSEGLTPAQTHEKEEVMRLLRPNVWKNESGQEAILAWIGVSSEDRCDTCCGKGFHDFSGLDAGFFGRGIYSTLHPHYAASYGAKEFDDNEVPANYSFLVLVLVTLGNSYPLTRAVDCKPGYQYCNFWDDRGEGKSLKAQFNSHIAPIKASRGYQLPEHVSEADFVEIVVSEPNQILPLYKFKLVRRDMI